MARYSINSVFFDIPETCLTPAIEQAIESGRYEHTEAAALKRHLRETDRVLDLGAGAGFLSTLAALTVGDDRVVGIEANPEMAEAAQANVRLNGMAKTRIIHGAVVADDYAEQSVRFLKRQAFWAGAVDQDGPERARHIDVPALRIGDLLKAHQPDVVILDIEGGEAALASTVWPVPVRLIVMEIHTGQYSRDALNAIFTGLFREGFSYCPWGTRGETVVFERPGDA